MRTINIRLLLVSFGLVAIVATGASLLQTMQVRRSASVLLSQAQRKMQNGQPRQALSYIVRYTQLVPQNIDAQVLLADTFANVGQRQSAIKWYERALVRDASRHAARLRLVELEISGHQYSSAKGHLVDFLVRYTPDDPRVYALLGQCHEGLGEFDKAIDRYNEAIRRDPKSIDAYSRLAEVHRTERKDVVEADALMDRLIVAAPDSPHAHLARADYRAKYHLGGVLDDVRAAVKLAPKDTQILFRAARTSQTLASETRDFTPLLAESERYARDGLAIRPRFSGWYMVLAQIDRRRGDIEKGVQHIEEGLLAIPHDGDLQWNLADFLIQQNRIEDGLGIVTRLGDQGYPKVPLEYLVALVDARRMRYVDAAERLRKIRDKMDPWPDLARQTEYWLGVCYQHLGEYGLQVTSFRNAVKIDPTWIPARQWLANALAKTGRIDESITEYEELTKVSGVPSTAFQELATLFVLRELQRREADRDWGRVEALLSRAEKLDPEADNYVILRAEIEASRQGRDSARQLFTDGMKAHPKSAAIPLALAALEQAAEKWDQAGQLIQKTRDKFGDIIEVRLAEMRFAIQRDGVKSFEKLQSLEQKPFAADNERKQLWRTSLAAGYYTLGKSADAARIWQQALEQEPDNIRLHMYLFDLALAAGDDSRMQKLLSDIRRVERSEEQPLWKYGEATRLIMLARKGDQSSLPKAEQLLEEVRAVRQTWARIPLLGAEIDEIRGRYDKVVEHYLAAIDLGERSPTIVRRVVELLYREHRYTEADQVLHKLEAMQLPITGDLGRLAADVSFRVQDFGRAMQIAAQVIGNSDSYQDLVWMAQLHSVMRQPQAAEEKLRLAIKKDPKLPDAWIALVQHLVRNQNKEKARLAIAVLAKNVPPESANLVEAVCLEALNDVSAAVTKFSAAADSPKADPIVLRAAAQFFMSHNLPSKSEPILKRLIDFPQAPAADVRWARRNLAAVWLATSDTAAKQKAIQLVEANLKQNSTSTEDRRAKALCLEALGGKENIESALAIVQGLINSQQSMPVDYLMAYRLCLQLNRTVEARGFLEEHTFKNSKDAQTLAGYIAFLIAQDELTEAGAWIARLQRLCEEDTKRLAAAKSSSDEIRRVHGYVVAAAWLNAQLCAKQGNPSKAVAVISDGVKATNSRVKLTAADAAEILERLAAQVAPNDEAAAKQLITAAEALLRSDVDTPSTSVALIGFLARRDRLAEAATVWRERFSAKAADEFAMAAAALAANPKLSGSDLKDMLSKIQAARGPHPSKALLAGLGQLLTFNEQHLEAIAVYREMLRLDPKDVGTLNNLACYLALSGAGKDEALQLINKAIEFQGATPALLDSRGMILLELNRPNDALIDLQRATATMQSAAMYLHLAAAQKRLKRSDESTASMERAHKSGLDPYRLHPLERARYDDLLKNAAL